MKLFIFGSTGDLTKRKVLPALQSLKKENLKIYALGRRDFTNEVYQKFICKKECNKNFKKKINYIQINYNSKNICKACIPHLNKQEKNYFYVSLPPKLYKQTLISLGKLKKQDYKLKILIEKPFGGDLKDSKEIKKTIKRNNLQGEIFISDHYLFKEKILNLEKKKFKKLKLISVEKLGLERRVNFYDDIGAIKDMIQSHLINVLFKIIPNINELKNFKIEKFYRGQYGNGKNKGYVKELGRKSQTETFAYILINTGKRKIEFITGKAFNKKDSRIIIDNKEILIGSENSYVKLFKKFFSNNKEHFPNIKEIIFAWKITEKLLKKEPNLFYYNKNSNLREVLNKL